MQLYTFSPQIWVCCCCCDCGFELRTSHLQSRCSIAQATPLVHFAMVILEMGVSWTISQAIFKPWSPPNIGLKLQAWATDWCPVTFFSLKQNLLSFLHYVLTMCTLSWLFILFLVIILMVQMDEARCDTLTCVYSV
jgi:hypothetical protein